MADRESSQVGYRLRIQPPDLARHPDPVKLMWFGWILQLGLEAKDKELARGWDRFGNVHPLRPRTIKYRKSEVGPTFKNAPRLTPSYARSRVRALLTGRAHTNSAEFFWSFDAVTGRSFAVILGYAAEKGHDVFGLSDLGTAWVLAEASKKWDAWKASAHVGTPATIPPPPAIPGARPVRQPIRTVRITGTPALEHFDLPKGALGSIKQAMAAGRFPGFRRLNARGEQWRPQRDAGPLAPASYSGGQRHRLERALGVSFRPAPMAAAQRETTILVDLGKLEDAWAATQNEPGYIGGGGRGGYQREYERFARQLLKARATDQAVTMPQVALDERGKLLVRGGEAALAVFRDQGAATIPVTVPRSQGAEFRARFGATRQIFAAIWGTMRGLLA